MDELLLPPLLARTNKIEIITASVSFFISVSKKDQTYMRSDIFFFFLSLSFAEIDTTIFSVV